MSKSKDLREAAVTYKKAGNSYEDTGKVFGVSASTVHRWVRQYEETGDLSNKPLNRSFKKIDPEKLKAYVAEHPDDTQQEVATVFGCCNQAISQAYRRLGWKDTVKGDIVGNERINRSYISNVLKVYPSRKVTSQRKNLACGKFRAISRARL